MIPFLLTRIICNSYFQLKIAKWIESTNHCTLRDETHNWLLKIENENKIIPRGTEINITLAKNNLEQYYMDCEMKLCSSNIHNHTFTCQKGKKGQYMCRLCMVRGINALLARPLMLKLIKKE